MGKCFSKRKETEFCTDMLDMNSGPQPENQLFGIAPYQESASPRRGHPFNVKVLNPQDSDQSSAFTVKGSLSTYRQKPGEDKAVSISGAISQSLDRIGVGFICRKGLKPEEQNQDDFCVMVQDGKLLIGVFDGHGPSGHLVSNYVHSALPKLIIESDSSSSRFDLRNSFEQVQSDLLSFSRASSPPFTCAVSGTTASIMTLANGELVTAHVGDSRVVLGKRISGKMTAIALTTDHKPSEFKEKGRIEKAGGEVKRLKNDQPYRVYRRGSMSPGLSLSRAIGDQVAQSLGVSFIPEISVRPLTPQDEFVLLCSDGVWEFISIEEAVGLIDEFGRSRVREAVDALAGLAWTRWVQEEGDTVDDITAVVAYFPMPSI